MNGVGVPNQKQETAAKGTERPSPIIMIKTVNLLHFQAEDKDITGCSIEFRNTQNDIRVNKEMEDYTAKMNHLNGKKLAYFIYSKRS